MFKSYLCRFERISTLILFDVQKVYKQQRRANLLNNTLLIVRPPWKCILLILQVCLRIIVVFENQFEVDGLFVLFFRKFGMH